MSKVTTQADLCLNLVLPLTATHNFIPLPPFPPVPPPMPATPLSPAACAIELPVPAFWPPGAALGSNKFTTTVFHSHMTFCLEGHDCGKFIPHIQVLPAINNMLTLTQIPLSSRKANFSASTVKADGAAPACMTMISWPPTPMTYCADPMGMPFAGAETSHINSVVVGMTIWDWLAGAVAIVANMLLEYGLFKAKGGTKDFGREAGRTIAKSKAGNSVASFVVPGLVYQALPSNKKEVLEFLLKEGVGALTGSIKIIMTGEGEVSVKIPDFGGPFLQAGASASWSRSGRKNTFAVTGSGNAGTASGSANVSVKDGAVAAGASATSRSPVGLGSETLSVSTDKGIEHSETDISQSFWGFQNETVTSNPDGSTTRSNSR